jgi:hypothetical protein
MDKLPIIVAPFMNAGLAVPVMSVRCPVCVNEMALDGGEIAGASEFDCRCGAHLVIEAEQAIVSSVPAPVEESHGVMDAIAGVFKKSKK